MDPASLLLYRDIPLQFKEGSAVAVIASVAGDIRSGSTSAFAVSGLLNFLLGASLSQLFGQIKIIQLVIYSMGLNLNLPVNLIQFNKMFIGITNFDMLPSEELINGLFDITETEAASPRIELLQFESQNFLQNGGSLIVFFTIWFALLASSFLLSAIAHAFHNQEKLTRLARWLEDQLKWNGFFNLILTSQIELLLAAIIQLKYWRWEKNGDKVACNYALLLLFLNLLVPVLQLRIMVKHSRRTEHKLNDDALFVKRFGVLTDGLRTRLAIHLAF